MGWETIRGVDVRLERGAVWVMAGWTVLDGTALVTRGDNTCSTMADATISAAEKKDKFKQVNDLK